MFNHGEEDEYGVTTTVLLSGEDALSLDVLAEALKPLSMVVETSNTAWATLEKLKKNQYSALLIDRELPDASGIEVVREMRKWQKNCAALVFVQYPGTEGMVQALKNGAADVFEKPFPSNDVILERLKLAMTRQKLQSERDGFASRIAELEISASQQKPSVESSEHEAQRQQLLNERPVLVARLAELEAAARKPLLVESPESARRVLEAEGARDAALKQLAILQSTHTRDSGELQQRFDAIKNRHLKALTAMKQGAATIANILGQSTLPPATNNELRELRRLLTQVIEDRS